jgi:two-component system sensor histidine kinase KdpD
MSANRPPDYAQAESLDWDRAMSTIAHRLQSPVSAIQIYARLLRKHSPGGEEDFIRSVTGIEASARELNRVIHSLSQARAIGVDELDVYVEETEMKELLGECVELAAARLGDRPIEVSAGDDFIVRSDRMLVRDILDELLDNAARFSAPDSRINVEMDRSEDRVEVYVDDRGTGIPPESRESVFDPFVKLDPNRSGLGLGLYVARGAARAQGGDLAADETPGGGCRMVLSLPLR